MISRILNFIIVDNFWTFLILIGGGYLLYRQYEKDRFKKFKDLRNKLFSKEKANHTHPLRSEKKESKQGGKQK